MIRLLPIGLFLVHSISFLQAIRCQTSPNYSFYKYGDADKHVDLDFAGEGGLLQRLSSFLLFWENDADSCLAVDLIPSTVEPWQRKGSMFLLWPFFQSLCLGQFIETLTCALQGRPLMTETGMSIFEHSLAFAEAEGMLSNSMGLGPFGFPKNDSGSKVSADETALFARNTLFNKLNTTPEVLLLALISSLNNLSSQVLGVFNMQHRYRLLNTGVWGICFMGAFVWGLLSLRPEAGAESILLRIPTVCIVGFIPHLLIIIGMFLCAAIYSLALLLCFLSPPADAVRPRTLRERFQMARDNMQANAQLSTIRLDMHEDFYTALLKIGFSALTVASEAVYLNEGRRISVAPHTWVEEERLRELEGFQDFNDPTRSLSVQVDDVNTDKGTAETQRGKWRSGYGLQTSFKVKRSVTKSTGHRADGVGHMQRGGRYFMAYEYFEGIFWLFTNWFRVLANKVLDQIGISRRPAWLGRTNKKEGLERQQAASQPGTDTLDFWMLSEDGVLSLPKDNNIDVSEETRKRLAIANDMADDVDESELDEACYDWWKNNGWWGEKDDSGTYQPTQENASDDDDATSIITSVSTSIASSIRASVEPGSGRSTPTQETYHHHRSHNHSQSVTDHTLDPEYLASLLNPVTQTARHEAQMLSHHLLAPTITTRSRWAQARSTEAAKLVTSTRLRPPNSTIPSSRPLTPDEEAQLLEQLILSRRKTSSQHRRSHHEHSTSSQTNIDSSNLDNTIPNPTQPAIDQNDPSSSPYSSYASGEGATWRSGGEGAGSGGPQCVVCQSSPRTVLAWPCRCLSLCEECRVSLAMNNFATCVCCRRDVVGFSRLYVP